MEREAMRFNIGDKVISKPKWGSDIKISGKVIDTVYVNQKVWIEIDDGFTYEWYQASQFRQVKSY